MKIHGIIGILVLVASEIFMFKGVEPFVTWFYDFAWWSYILIIDSIIYYLSTPKEGKDQKKTPIQQKLKGNSLLCNRRREFILLMAWSVCFWLIYEAANLVLKNWHYINLPANTWVRWVGYFIAFATVLPAVFETTELLETAGIFKNNRVKRIKVTKNVHILFYILGLTFLITPLIFPDYCFALIWGCFVFLLEPVNYMWGGRSLLRDWENGTFRKFYLLLLGGLICGALWELWNYWASAKWVYTVPFVGKLKIFEMPLLGYIGFPPFAVECYVMYNFVSLFRYNRTWEKDSTDKAPGKKVNWLVSLITVIGLILFYILMFYLIDKNTVLSYR